MNNDSFWEANLDEIKRGYRWDEKMESFVCIVCGAAFLQGQVFPIEDRFFDAEKSAKLHVAQEHGSMFQVLLGLDKKYTGITDHQKKLLTFFYKGYSDKEICDELGGSASTIRNHRFNLKEKERQAKAFLAMMELLKDTLDKRDKSEDTKGNPKGGTASPVITEAEAEKVLRSCFKEGLEGPLTRFPDKEKRRIIILNHLIRKFAQNRKYNEKEVNEIIKEVYPDYAIIRRCFIDYGFMERADDGSAYWVKADGNSDDSLEQVQAEKGDSMDKERRSQIKREYKESFRDMGIIQIKNQQTGKVFIETSKNLSAAFNKNRFTLMHGAHRNKELQQDWNTYGADQFTFEVLEQIKPTEEVNRDCTEELKMLEEIWMDKLQPYGEKGYHKIPKER
ncbi:DUF2087 domain-containing protein [Heliobacillus mobilis]|uniref:DUF2087 domain-containing protein n=1 Tax=Heliobacterium mobile TaxID=28064 RepID=A0A6I3SLY4_HELMO|nr:DUF2087 domain-containing protein [Heliobacterium mobile]MTV49971.1 DUF2087 domain-containing protein [Heliobacterium mobile]